MSSSSATGACSRSPSPSTPEASDSLEPVVVQNDGDYSWNLSANKRLDGKLPWESSSDMLVDARKPETSLNMFAFNDLIQEDACDEPMTSGYNSSAQAMNPSYPVGALGTIPAATPSITQFLSHLASPTEAAPSSPPTSKGTPTTSHNVVSPARDACRNLPIIVPTCPEHGVKSRVETQIRVTVDLAYASSSVEDSNYDRVGSWKWLKLPKGTSTKKRTRKEGKIAPTADDMLFLGIDVTCASPPHTRVLSCQSCQNRESKRIARKIAARVRPPRSDSESPEDVRTESNISKPEDATSIIQFNCPEVVDFSTGSAVLPLRITCYCRHHREKVGFRVHFTMFDGAGHVVGTGISGPIMITDDHKSTGVSATKKGTETPGGRRDGTASSKKRAKPYDVGRPESRKPSVGPTPPSALSSLPVTRAGSPSQSLDASFWLQDGSAMIPDLPWDPIASLPSPCASNTSADAADAQPAVQPLPVVANPMPMPLPLARPFMLFGPDGTVSLSQLPTPVIHRLVPPKGPICGGTEVTILGTNFHASMDLKCVFGETIASSTQRWSDNTLVCVVPPRLTAGVVPIWIEGVETAAEGAQAPLFTYEDESGRALMELALQVLGIKLTGKVEDPKHVAMRIVGSAGGGDSQGGTDVSNMMQLVSMGLPNSSPRDTANFEKLILDVLSLVDVNVNSPSPFSVSQAISYQTHSGQTLLHVAVALNLPAVVDFLLARGVDYDLRDRNGWTALHFAAAGGVKECARMLVAAGADLHVVNARGQVPRELATRSFFDGMHQFIPEGEAEPISSDREEDEEAAWGDVEEDSSDDARTRVNRRRAGRRKQDVLSSSHRPSEAIADHASSSDGLHVPPGPAEKQAPVDDKHVAATYADLIQRTFAQLQRSKGMLPMMPHLSNLPGVRAVPWSALPQLPMVFPVFVPTPAWPAFLDKRSYSSDSSAEPEAGEGIRARRPVTAAVKTANEWIAFWERIMQGMAASAPAQEVEDAPPPVYTPRATNPEDVSAGSPRPDEAESSATAAAASESAVARRAEYPVDTIPEHVVDAYEYRPAKTKSTKLRRKEDRMLIMFWVPALFAGFMWAFLTGISMALQGMKTVVATKTGIYL